MKQKYHVKLSESERKQLQKHKQSLKHSMESKKRACVLLDLDESDGRHPATTKAIAAHNGVSELSVRKYRQQFATRGLEGALLRKKRDTPPEGKGDGGSGGAYHRHLLQHTAGRQSRLEYADDCRQNRVGWDR